MQVRKMNTQWSIYAMGIAITVLAFIFGAFLFGSVAHETSHAIVCLLFGLPFSWSLTQVTFMASSDPWVNTLVKLAGGMGQALVSLLFVWYLLILEKYALRKSPDALRLFTRSIFFGFELSFLTIGLQGVVNGVWEGFFFPNYEQIHADFFIWGTVTLICGIISFYIMYHRRSRFFKQIRSHIWKTPLQLAGWGKKYKGDFIASAIAFLIPFLIGWSIQGLKDVVTITSLFGLIIVSLILLLGNEGCFQFILKRFIRARFQYPINIGVLNGYLSKDKTGKTLNRPYTEYEPHEWFDAFSSETEFSVNWISAGEISTKFDVIINPFGELYPEVDKPNLSTLRKIVHYVQGGGIFVNVAGLAFYYLWDGEKQDLSGPLYETYAINSIPGLLLRQVLLDTSYLLDTWLYKQFGIRTTFFDKSVIRVHSVLDAHFHGLDIVGDDTNVLEFRSAYRAEKENATLVPLLRAEYKIKRPDGKELSFECYPIAAVKNGKGCLILNGMELIKARPQDFQKIVEAIKLVVKKLSLEGTI